MCLAWNERVIGLRGERAVEAAGENTRLSREHICLEICLPVAIRYIPRATSNAEKDRTSAPHARQSKLMYCPRAILYPSARESFRKCSSTLVSDQAPCGRLDAQKRRENLRPHIRKTTAPSDAGL